MSELMRRLSLDNGNILLDNNEDAPIYIGNNALTSMVLWKGHIYIVGENNTFLRVHQNLLVEALPLTAGIFLQNE